ncbi:MAG TPA: hypothetical protein VGK48_21680 [Terriglobia bacterium]|jgi:hypothetical protein
MREERTITQFGRVPIHRLSWSAIFGGTFFALGIMTILGLFGLAVGAAATGLKGATAGVDVWLGVWSLVTLFVGFLAGGWLAAKSSESQAKSDGRLHGLVVWALGSVALLYFALNTTRMAEMVGSVTGRIQPLNLTSGLGNISATTISWALIAVIFGLIGGLVGGHAGGYTEAVSSTTVRRAA